MNPDTGELYTPEDFNVISYEDVGVGMLAGRDLGRRRASWRTTAYQRHASAVRRRVARRAGPTAGTTPRRAATSSSPTGSQLGASHQLWQMNEINKLIWPAPNGIGMIDQAAWDRTVEIAQNTPNLEGTTVLTAADRRRLHERHRERGARVLDEMGIDTTGAGFAPIEVTLKEGGASAARRATR